MFKGIATLLGAALITISASIFVGMLLSLPVMLLWNYCLVGAVAGVYEISWLQALGIMILCSFLFKSSTTSKSDQD